MSNNNNNLPNNVPGNAGRPRRNLPNFHRPGNDVGQTPLLNGIPIDHVRDSFGHTPSEYRESIRVLTNHNNELEAENDELLERLDAQEARRMNIFWAAQGVRLEEFYNVPHDAEEPHVEPVVFAPLPPPRPAYWMPDGIILCPCCDYPMNVGQRTCGPNCVDLSDLID